MQTSCVVDEKFVPKVGMIFKTLEEAGKFYKHYSKLAGFSTKIRNTTWERDKIKNQLIVCSREGMWKSKISPTLKTNSSAGLNCPARIYVHIIKDVGLWIISKVVLNHSRPCCADQAEMLKQHRELSMFVRRTIETHEKDGIRLSKTYQSFVAATGSHRELGFIEKDVRNYIIREVRNISEEDDAKEFGKYLVRMKEKNQNFFFELNLEGDHCIKHAFWADARSRAAFNYFGDVVLFGTTYNTNRSLRQFVKQYDNCLASREQAEREFDAADFHTMISCATKSAIEAQFQHVYTHEKFKKVQAQFRGKVNCITRSMHFTLGFTTYEGQIVPPFPRCPKL
ncbi:Protein FAR1-RELATED SEQUENCE [Arachis hypogaea]|nr:Protein FAR1-RELATED SEQUENCE [Arachis hypogaea]